MIKHKTIWTVDSKFTYKCSSKIKIRVQFFKQPLDCVDLVKYYSSVLFLYFDRDSTQIVQVTLLAKTLASKCTLCSNKILQFLTGVTD